MLLIAAAPAYAQSPQPTPAGCQQLASQPLPNMTITSAAVSPAADGAPASCRVAATLTPTPDSDIRIEVWMPMTGWNGKFHSAGGAQGGNTSAIGGSINYPPMLTALKQGFATAGTDGGHQGATLAFAPDHPEKVVDFGYRAVHEMTVAAKTLMTAFYGSGPRYSYWNACAAGGRQGWQEVQRYPADYDGLLAGDPARDWTHLQAWSLWVWQSAHASEASYIPPSKYPALHRAVLDACDALDGVSDSVLENPTACHFDPAVLACKSGDSDSCLTPPQVEAARRIYAPARNPRTGATIFPGLLPGSEPGWAGLAGPNPPFYATETFKYLAFNDPSWSPTTRPIDFDADVAKADATGAALNANNPDLRPFFARGGKIITYAGWADPLISPLNDVGFYDKVSSTVGAAQVDRSYRLYMVPGMTHCRGGQGTDTFDMLSALEQWVEQGKAPGRIEASRVVNGTVQRTRPLCPYPQVAKYSGNGSTDDAANFTCVKE